MCAGAQRMYKNLAEWLLEPHVTRMLVLILVNEKALPVFLFVTAIFHAKIVTISLIPSSFLLSVSFIFVPCTYIIQLYSLTSTVKIKYTRYSLFSPYLYKHLGSQFRKSEFSHESVSKQIPGTCVKFISLKLPGVFLPLNMQLWSSNFAI